MSRLITILLLVLLATISSMQIGVIIGGASSRKVWQQAAIKHNAAHWEVTPDGITVFVWNKEEE